MSRVSVTQPEFNYILHGDVGERRSLYGRMERFERVNVHVAPKLATALRRHPAFALSTCWKQTMGRSGLSPFVMHYLLEDKRSIEDFLGYIKKQHYKIWNYHYCGTTMLPVVSSFASINWDALSSYKLLNGGRPPLLRDPWEQNYVARQTEKREEAEREGLVLYANVLSEANVDEGMRTFRGSSISKAHWQHLKGVAGIYK